MWKDEYCELPPDENKYDKIAFLVAMIGATTVAIMQPDNQLLVVVVGLGLYIGMRWSRAV